MKFYATLICRNKVSWIPWRHCFKGRPIPSMMFFNHAIHRRKTMSSQLAKIQDIRSGTKVWPMPLYLRSWGDTTYCCKKFSIHKVMMNMEQCMAWHLCLTISLGGHSLFPKLVRPVTLQNMFWSLQCRLLVVIIISTLQSVTTLA